jgi:hypothetical protein
LRGERGAGEWQSRPIAVRHARARPLMSPSPPWPRSARRCRLRQPNRPELPRLDRCIDVLARSLRDVETWLGAGPLEAEVLYGESGLPLFFGDGIRDELVQAPDEGVAFRGLIDALQGMVDDSANMDW